MTDKQKNFVVRTITGTLFVAIMVAGFLNPRAMVFLFALITGLSVWEYTGLVNGIDDVRVNRFISTVAGVYLFLAVAAWRMGLVANFIIVVPYLLTIVYLFVSGLFTCSKNPVADWAYTMLGQMYVALPLSMINILAFEVDGQWGVNFDPLLPLSIFIFLWTNDSGAYCCGSLLGRHKLFPRVSPGKSWEGSIGGCVLVLAVAALIGWWANNGDMKHQLGMAAWMGLGLVVVVFGTLGDLVESLFKRTLGIKDSGNLLPGHGGMLDRFDSALMAIPAAVIYLYTLTLYTQM
ncbi:MAG: phosphatidate cytidylyltransferase [Prevotella sp.]|uniref:phosphatidate cytidylyltransferase n=1 Tax=Prevotella sp. P3-122 TaxID=2024223 RepID=UPI000B975CB5|nr:phosphatidate cytidylyltransferase [Prevotella sp. P3-122]MDY3876270.1 phosphatidate cytidylyltransferase [Prevotella sp.]MDY3898339.1 phosphatidate cytidylyltransferase [Prevotella sp.]MDY5084752.1 phosphatidate cytidylyltransferase [Prevotella sp.]OYP60279.1 phosphatidate cytidylyltransferase [Prevotella sp. P3-122]